MPRRYSQFLKANLWRTFGQAGLLSVALAGPVYAQSSGAPSPDVQFQQNQDGKIQVILGDTAPSSIGTEKAGLKIVFAGKVTIDLAALRRIPGLEGTKIRPDRADTILILRGSEGKVEASTAGGQLVLIPERHVARVDKPAPPVKAGRNREARSKDARGKESHASDPSAAELEALRKSVAGQLAVLNLGQSDAPSSVNNNGGNANRNDRGNDTASNYGSGTNANANNNVPSGSAHDGDVPPVPGAPGPRLPPCKALPLATWQGTGKYADWAVALRGRLARAPDSLDALAALAEFYVSHWEPQEALALLSGWVDDDPGAKQRLRLLQVRDIAALMLHQPVGVNSSLLASQPDCEAPENAIWKALQAAANNDTAGVLANVRKARAELDDIPEPMRTGFALAIADASHNDPDTLKYMVAALRSSSGGTMADVNGRWLLLASNAEAEHNSVDEELYLQHAADNPYNVPGLTAQVRLGRLQIRRPDDVGMKADKMLMDVARTYRHDSIGQEAALILAKQRMADGNFPAAFQLADESAQADRNPGESAGALYCAHLLRLLLVDAKGKPLPPTADRMALFWRYEGYATPGQPGDDIRIGATRLLLSQNFADSALDVARQISPASLKDPDTLLLRARTEAMAQTGDASAAIAMAQTQPTSDLTNTIVAIALARLGRLQEAARTAGSVNTTEGRQMRADDLYKAGLWPDATAAYADLLRDPDLTPPQRTEATRRYALTVSLAQKPPSDAPTKSLMVTDKLSDRLQSIGTPNQEEEPPVTEIRTALQRAKKIETILSP